MAETERGTNLDVDSRHQDVRLDIHGRGRSDIAFNLNSAGKDVNLGIDNRHSDVRLDIQGRGHGSMTFDLRGGSGRQKSYEGPYTVVSEADVMQILPTANKVMDEDMVVLPIPYFETSNPKGGLTVCIGGD